MISDKLKLTPPKYSTSKFSQAHITEEVDGDEDLDQAAARYFFHVPDDLIHKSEEDEAVLKQFKANIKHVDGRYEVALPWKPEAELLESNFSLKPEPDLSSCFCNLDCSQIFCSDTKNRRWIS